MSDTSNIDEAAMILNIMEEEKKKNRGKQPPRRSWWRRTKELMHETFNPDKKDFSYHIFLAVLFFLLYVAIIYDNWNRVTYGYFLVTIPIVCAVEAFLISLAVENKKKINRRKRIQDKWKEKQKQSTNNC